jgi:CDP-diacylglycerol---glycerol-3-phosphate 3-phosphatidyltransferase
MNLANLITVGRIALVPVFVVVAYGETTRAALVAFGVFAIASASDSLDGYLARRHRTVSRAGQFLDPLADKLLIGAALVVLVTTRDFPVVVAVLIGGREIAVQWLRTRIVSKGGTLPASAMAKWKTTLQAIMVLWWLLPWDATNPGHWVVLSVALASTLWSGGEYFVEAAARRKAAA